MGSENSSSSFSSSSSSRDPEIDSLDTALAQMQQQQEQQLPPLETPSSTSTALIIPSSSSFAPLFDMVYDLKGQVQTLRGELNKTQEEVRKLKRKQTEMQWDRQMDKLNKVSKELEEMVKSRVPIQPLPSRPPPRPVSTFAEKVREDLRDFETWPWKSQEKEKEEEVETEDDEDAVVEVPKKKKKKIATKRSNRRGTRLTFESST